MMLHLKRQGKGFTLIELLVVIAIIGILSSVVLSSLDSARKRARDTKRIAELKSLQIALALYYEAQGAYPATLSVLETQDYISSMPVDPQDTPPHVYTYTGVDTDSSLGTCESYYLSVGLEADNMVLDPTDDMASVDVGEAECTGTDAFLAGSGADPEFIYRLRPY